MKSKLNNDFESNNAPLPKKLDKNSSSFVPPEVEKKKLSGTQSDMFEKSVPTPAIPLINMSTLTNRAEFEKTIAYINQLKNKATREEAFKQLNNRRDIEPHLAVLLWHSVGTIAILLQEVISIYPHLTNMTLNQNRSERICNVLGLFQCLALDNRTRLLFLKSCIISQSAPLRLPSYQHSEQAAAVRAPTGHQSRSDRSPGQRRGFVRSNQVFGED